MEGFAVDEAGVVTLEAGKYLNNFLQMPVVLVMFLLGAVLLVAGVVQNLFSDIIMSSQGFAVSEYHVLKPVTFIFLS